MLAMRERQYVNQSAAARMRGVSRQRISELVSKGRFTTPVDEAGKLIKGAVYVDEVENLIEAKRGRPSLTLEERKERGLDLFQVNDTVVWKHAPRGGFGFTIDITARVQKIALKKLLLEFKNGDGELQTTWVQKEVCDLLARPI